MLNAHQYRYNNSECSLRLLHVHSSYLHEEKTEFRARIFIGFLKKGREAGAGDFMYVHNYISHFRYLLYKN